MGPLGQVPPRRAEMVRGIPEPLDFTPLGLFAKVDRRAAGDAVKNQTVPQPIDALLLRMAARGAFDRQIAVLVVHRTPLRTDASGAAE